MPPDTHKLLEDVRRAADLIAQFTRDRSFSEYESDVMLRSAVERQFEIIGEALSRLAKSDRATAERIQDHHKIVAFRNLVIHGYDAVDDQIVWDVAHHELRVLQQNVATLLKEQAQVNDRDGGECRP